MPLKPNAEGSAWFPVRGVYVRRRTFFPELGRGNRVNPIMVDSFDEDDAHGFTTPERAALYWKKAANAYRQACSAESAEAKKLYMQIAMAWATLADEMERSPLPLGEAPDYLAKH